MIDDSIIHPPPFPGSTEWPTGSTSETSSQAERGASLLLSSCTTACMSTLLVSDNFLHLLMLFPVTTFTETPTCCLAPFKLSNVKLSINIVKICACRSCRWRPIWPFCHHPNCSCIVCTSCWSSSKDFCALTVLAPSPAGFSPTKMNLELAYYCSADHRLNPIIEILLQHRYHQCYHNITTAPVYREVVLDAVLDHNLYF